MPFGIQVDHAGTTARVVPIGEVDIATVGRIDKRLRELRDAGARRLVLDLRRLTFIDSSGLQMILEWDAAARQNGISFTLIEGPPAVQRLFGLTGVLDRLAFR